MPEPPKRTEYSKSGCKECKRRKIKCDEFIKPPPDARLVINHQNKRSCWQCTRLKKICEYPMKGERVLRVSLKKQQQNKKLHNSGPDTDSSSASNAGTEDARKSYFSAFHDQIHNASTPSQNLPAIKSSPIPLWMSNHPNQCSMEVYNTALSFNHAPKGAIYTSVSNNSPLDQESSVSNDILRLNSQGSSDLALLACDLNNLVNDMISRTGKGEEVTNSNRLNFESTPTSLSIESESFEFHSHFEASQGDIPKNIGLDIFNVSLEVSIYLKEFYDGFSSVIMPFTAFDSGTQAHFNPVRDTLLYYASNEPFLLAAILAQGATSRFQKSGYNSDNQAYRRYLSKCLKLLGAALIRSSDKRSSSILGNIEPVLLAVLLLSSSNAANTTQNWRPHLQGAKGILLRHSTIQKNQQASTTILLCKCWFVSFEILAGLGSKIGGTIESDEDLEVLLHFDASDVNLLKKMGMILGNGFFLIGGYHVDLIPTFKGLIKQLNKYRKDQNHVFADTSEYIRLLADFERFRLFEFVHKKAILSSDDFLGGYIPSGYLLDPVSVNNNHHVLSWIDTSHQVYCLAGIVTILTNFLEMSHESPQVQSIAKDLLSFSSVLSQFSNTPSSIKCSVMMIQWPMIVAGLISTKPEDQNNVLKFFEAARGVGSGCADHFISRLKSSWSNESPRSILSFSDNIDAVTY